MSDDFPNEVEMEVALPVRVEYARNSSGDLEIIALYPQLSILPRGTALPISEVSAGERRALLRALADEEDLRASARSAERAWQNHAARTAGENHA